jgi:hypothetical protein
MLQLLTLNTVTELICLLVAVIMLWNVREFQWRSMIIFMLLICATEMTGVYIKQSENEKKSATLKSNGIKKINGKIHPDVKTSNVVKPGIAKKQPDKKQHFKSNEWLYNLLLPFQAGFITLMFFYILRGYMRISVFIIVEMLLLLSLYLYETSVHKGIYKYNHLTNICLLIIISLYSLLYYYYLIRDSRYVNLTKHANFWWVTGIFFFYFGTTACNIFFDLLKPNPKGTIANLTYHIYSAFIPILYGCWSYAFICKKWEPRTSQA